jgi:hypothetical protein
MNGIILKDESYNSIGACMAVHRSLVVVYQEALEEEFKLRSIRYVKEQMLTITYKGKLLSTKQTLYVMKM